MKLGTKLHQVYLEIEKNRINTQNFSNMRYKHEKTDFLNTLLIKQKKIEWSNYKPCTTHLQIPEIYQRFTEHPENFMYVSH